MNKSPEEIFIDRISPSLLLYSRKVNAHKFLCPCCQSTGRDDNGKQIAPSGAKGYLYKINNIWHFECKKLKRCGKSHAFEKFLEIFFPQEHLEYVLLRDQLGTTGFQTNCPSLETLLKKRGMLSGQPPEFRPERFHQHLQRPAVPPAAPDAPASPKVTKLPPMRSPQQQAGHQSRLNHQVKQRQEQRRHRDGELW